MNELKCRFKVIKDFVGKKTTGDDVMDFEFACLQLRMIFELIAFSTIASHEQKKSALSKNIKNGFNAHTIFKQVERINPEFYPKPIALIPSKEAKGSPNRHPHFDDKIRGFISREEFSQLYNQCGAVLHAQNPLTPKNRQLKPKDLIDAFKLIWGLLHVHVITLYNEQTIWLVHMHHPDDGKSVEIREAVPKETAKPSNPPPTTRVSTPPVRRPR